MPIFYDPSARKWNVTQEKTDYKTDYPTNFPTKLKTNYPEVTVYYETVTKRRDVQKQRTVYKSVSVERPVERSRTVTGPDGYPRTEYYTVTERYNTTEPVTEYYTEPETYTEQEMRTRPDYEAIRVNEQNKNANRINTETNKSNDQLNKNNTKTNADNVAKNRAYDTTVATATRTQGGDYVAQREIIRKLPVDQQTKNTLENYYKGFYLNEKLKEWDSKLGAKPPYGNFDPKFYKEQNPTAAQEWEKAVANDDVDVTERYGENNFYWQHYTNQGRAAGKRGNPVEKTIQADTYKELKPTDKEIQDVRTKQLNIAPGTEAQSLASSLNERILKIPEVQKAWQEAKNGDAYWKSLAQANYLNVSDANQFAALFRLSTRDQDKQVAFANNLNADPQNRITDLENELNVIAGEGRTADVQRFGALVQDALSKTVSKLKEVNAQNEQLAIMRGFSSFGEITDINKELTNSLLGDTGIGGILEFTSGGKAGESLEKTLEKTTGVKSNVTYNWQDWFNKELNKQYDKDIELGYTTKDAKANVKITKEFANKFIDEYLKPRFDTSRSMDEFIEYMDIRQNEQTPFTTQDVFTGLKDIANVRAKSYLDEIQKTDDRLFDAEFYFNPTGNRARSSDYATQAKEVAEEWDLAKKQVAQKDGYWYQQAYRFGVDVNDKAAFARMHFQTKGQGKGFDAAKDILNASAVQDYIASNIAPALKDYVAKNPNVFSKFVLPEEFANEMLKGLNPEDKSQWDTVLTKLGLTDFKGTLNELKEYIIETFRTGSAQKIREQIKYLNERQLTPTQARLGVSYIERPEDYLGKPATPQTELYRTFQSAGYRGSEDDFYSKFFPDLDKTEQQLLTKAGKGKGLETVSLNLKDPLEAYGKLGTLLGKDEEEMTVTPTTRPSSFFKLGLEDEEEPDYKSKTGNQILGEFTSLFKGF